jgi:hypothetical protein
MYLFNPLYSYDPENIPAYYEGQKLYSFSANKYYKKTKYFWYFWLFPYPVVGLATSVITLPIYAAQSAHANNHRKFDLAAGTFPSVKYESNQIVNEITLGKLDPGTHEVSFDHKSSCLGKLKIAELERICSSSSSFLKDSNPYRKMIQSTSTSHVFGASDTADLKKHLKELAEMDMYRDGFSVKKIKDFAVLETNFFDASRPFVHSVSLSAKNLVWSFNDYIVLNAGNFIGRQLSVPEDTVRENNFNIPYQKQFIYNISIPVPEGYVVENLKEFNAKKETEAGSFSAEASMEGNMIRIKTRKSYKFRTYTSGNASDVYGFLAEAEKYYNKKMIFKKSSGKSE